MHGGLVYHFAAKVCNKSGSVLNHPGTFALSG